MDPLSISGGCLGIVANISTIVRDISKFISYVKEASKDMADVGGDLSALSISLTALSEDAKLNAETIPPDVAENIMSAVNQCGSVVAEISSLLQKMGTGKTPRKLQWVAFGRSDVAKLRLSLEAHKATLNIALNMITQ